MSVTGQGAHSDPFLIARLARAAWDFDDHDTDAPDRFGEALGASDPMRRLFATLDRVAGLDLGVLFEGESGVGKDLLARALHARSTRARGPFVVVDCGAISPHLIESELFGHERGAFTGADSARRGVFEDAHGGTLFLDEIGELPFELQPKLLRALEQREIRPVGGRATRTIDVRLIAATNRNLSIATQTGAFRSDLFYRLAVVRATVPPLRDRREDILMIARTMLRAIKKDEAADFPPEIASQLLSHAWPGNVRELRNVVERFVAFGPGMPLFEAYEARPTEPDLASLPYHEAKKRVLDHFDETYLPRVLARAGGVVTRAAALAGVARPSFYRMLDRLRATGAASQGHADARVQNEADRESESIPAPALPILAPE